VDGDVVRFLGDVDQRSFTSTARRTSDKHLAKAEISLLSQETPKSNRHAHRSVREAGLHFEHFRRRRAPLLGDMAQCS